MMMTIPHVVSWKKFFNSAMLALSLAVPGKTAAQNASQLIESALIPLPSALRADATVLGISSVGHYEPIRTGTNAIVCEVDDPDRYGMSVICYHESMLAIRLRNRELVVEGRDRQERAATLIREYEEGRVTAPPVASAFIVRGPEGCYNFAYASLCDEARIDYLVYTPRLGHRDLGLPDQEVGDWPYMHSEGTMLAHITIDGTGFVLPDP